MSEQGKKRKDSGSDDASNGNEAKVRKFSETVFSLNEDFWRDVLDYLDVGDQLSFASSNVTFGQIFRRYASHRHKHIDESFIRNIDDDSLETLLQSIGEDLVSYDSGLNRSSSGDKHLWLLRSYCKNLKNLKMVFRRFTAGWADLNSLKHLKSLHAHLYYRDMGNQCTDFVRNLKQFTCLRKLILEARSYNGIGLHVLDQLEYLEVGAYPGFHADSLADCCQTMKQLRHLDFGYHIQNITNNNFEILVANCQQLERLAFGVEYFDPTVRYELVSQLPRLQHLKVWHGGSIRGLFIDGLINKKGSPVESLILDGLELFEEQVKHLCEISTLKELQVSCKTVPLEHLLKLKNLVYLHISMPSITDDELLGILKGLRHLKVLNIRNNINIGCSFINRLRSWVSEQTEPRENIKIYLETSALLDNVNVEPLVKIIKGSLRDPILIREELIERIKN